MIPQVSAIKVVHDEIKIIPILKSVDHVNQKWMTQLREVLSFIHHRRDWFLVYDLCLTHQFHRVDLPRSLVLDLPYLTKTTLPNRHDLGKVQLCYFLMNSLTALAGLHHHGLTPFLLARNVVVFRPAISSWHLVSILMEKFATGPWGVNFERKVRSELNDCYIDSIGFCIKLNVFLYETSGVPKLAPLLWIIFEGVGLNESLPYWVFLVVLLCPIWSESGSE